jgi:hypothetical protein
MIMASYHTFFSSNLPCKKGFALLTNHGTLNVSRTKSFRYNHFFKIPKRSHVRVKHAVACMSTKHMLIYVT